VTVLAIVVVTSNARELGPRRKEQPLMRIEYHRPLDRFFRNHRERARMAIVSVLGIAKSFFCATSQPPRLVPGESRRVRRTVHRDFPRRNLQAEARR
jgi:hypothetical protein